MKLYEKISKLKIDEDETIAKYFEQVIAISNQMRLNGEDMSYTKIIEKILRTVLSKLETVVCPIKETQDI